MKDTNLCIHFDSSPSLKNYSIFSGKKILVFQEETSQVRKTKKIHSGEISFVFPKRKFFSHFRMNADQTINKKFPDTLG